MAKLRLQELSPEVMEEFVEWFRQEVASRDALEIAQFLDQCESVASSYSELCSFVCPSDATQ